MTTEEYKKGRLSIDVQGNKSKGGRTDRLSSQDIPINVISESAPLTEPSQKVN